MHDPMSPHLYSYVQRQQNELISDVICSQLQYGSKHTGAKYLSPSINAMRHWGGVYCVVYNIIPN